MSYTEPMPGSLKRKRKRRPEGISLSARLQLSETLGGQLAEVSGDLVKGLRLLDDSLSVERPLYLAVKEWTPPNAQSITPSRWTILPCRAAKQELNATHGLIRVPYRSRSVQALVQNLRLNAAPRLRGPAPFVEIRVTDAVPLRLDTIYVAFDSGSLSWTDTAQKKSLGSSVSKKLSARFLSTRAQEHARTNGTTDIAKSHDELRKLVRKSLVMSSIVHAGDTLPINDPKAAASGGPSAVATITACEPVSQGLIAETTRVVIVSADRPSELRARPSLNTLVQTEQASQTLTEVEEDTANEAFYTAAEDGNASSTSETASKKASFDISDTEDDSDGNLSDDPEDMISLTSPALGSQASGMLSSMTAATPKPFGKGTTGIHTPGSVFSSMTAATLRGGQPVRTKVLRTKGLLERIPDELLYPKPLPHEDEEARVYVDTTVLARLGCFSGDWIEITKAGDPALTGIASLGMSAFLSNDENVATETRAVKVFGLPESLSSKSAGKYQIQGRRRSESFSSNLGITVTPSVYLSPILLTNVGNPDFLRLTPMRMAEETIPGRMPGKMPPASLPPAAKEANLLKIQSPVSTDKAIDSSIFSGLVAYFEGKQRLVKTGDLIAIPFDESIGRAVYDGGSVEDGASNDILNYFGSPSASGRIKHSSDFTKVVWFQVGSVSGPNDIDQESPDVWSGLVSMVPSKTKMHQSGTQQRRVPPAMSGVWPYYAGVRSPPSSRDAKDSPLDRQVTMPVSNLQRRLRELVSTATSSRATHLGLPPLAILLHSTQRGIGKSHAAKSVCMDLGIHCFPIDAFDVLTEAAGGGGDNNTVGLFESRAERALQCGIEHTCLLIQHIESLSSDRMYTAIKDKLEDSRVLIATTTDLDKVPENLRGLFTHELEMSAPDEGEREAILQSIMSSISVPISSAVDFAAVAVKTAALVAGDLVDVVDRAIAAQATRLEALATAASGSSPIPVTVRDIQIAGGDAALSLVPADFELAVDEARKNFADSIGAPKIPNVQWSDVGGLANVKEAVIETIQLPLSRPELFAKGLKKRSGILFYGPPGTGKTLLAKAIATEFSLNFFSVKGPELLNMYIGESEANVRRVFQRARDARPCCVFFDELDSVAPKRGNQGDSGGVMDRIVSQLLAELDGMSDGDSEDGGGGAGVFVIGATNRPDLLDQALLRPGRFDKMLYLGISDTHDKQQKILEALTRKFVLHPSLQLSTVADKLPFTYTGADLYALCSDAMLKAVTRSARAVDDRIASINAARSTTDTPKPPITVAQFFDHHATDADLDVLVTEQDFLQANAELVPSVSAEELGHYERVRRDFEGDRTKKDQAQPQNDKQATQPGQALSQEELEAWQAAKIEEMMRSGFSDGSLARNNPKGPNGKGKARLSHMPPGVSNGTPPQNSDDSEARSSSRAGTDTTSAAEESDFVVRTSALNLNGKDETNGSSSGHGGSRRESRFFGKERSKDKEGQSKAKRAMSIFHKGKGRSDSSATGGSAGRSASESQRSETGAGAGAGADGDFGDAARDQGLYD
ncbi:AAA-domain-containing protein [Myriangium duriaei CBS 260.36]|uniref:Peroxisomal ATPase PEX6 n=1 Tax=Myriangium duriaei CBS 260.36 TaxID=1168546 RepID=A0A9P4IT10_9PEZI|nr:AAA-domain-containing protein [Myriangium duriaei CBS 260.36]